MKENIKIYTDYMTPDKKELQEGGLGKLGAVALVSKIRSITKKIKQTENVPRKLNLIASQNTYMAMMLLLKKE